MTLGSAQTAIQTNRSRLLALHRYVGLAVGPVICLLGLTGSVLVFRPEIERLLNPGLFHISPAAASRATLEEMRAIAVASSPDLDLYRIRLAAGERTSYEFILGRGSKFTRHVYVDPSSLRVLGVREAGSDFFFWLQSLHFDLLAGEAGRRANGAVAVFLLLVAFSGLVLWFKSKSAVTVRLWPRWGVRSARRDWGAHVSLGFWLTPFLILMAATALYFAFHDPVARFIYAVARSRPLPSLQPAQQSDRRASLDLLLANARNADPGGTFTLIRLPRTSGQHATVNYVLPRDLSDLGANAIHCDPSTGVVLGVDRLRDMELGPRIVAALVPLHFGTFGGLPTRLLWAFFGLMPSVLFYSGFAIWRRRRSQAALPGNVQRSERDCTSTLETANQ